MVDVDYAEKYKTGKSWVRDEFKAKIVEYNLYDKELSLKGKEIYVKYVEKLIKKLIMKLIVKCFEVDDLCLKSFYASSKKSNKLDSMVFNELSFNWKKKFLLFKECV